MADDVDRAGALEQQARDDALRDQKRRAARMFGSASTAEICIACEELIPAARRAAIPGCALCVGCQARREHGGQA